MAKKPNHSVLRASKIPDPPDHLWRFHEKGILPDDEIMAAYFWEYGLEASKALVIAKVEAAREEAATLREQQVRLLKMRGDPKPRKLESWKLIQLQVLESDQDSDCFKPKIEPPAWIQFLASCRDFPSKHWLELSQKVRNSIDKNKLSGLSRHELRALEASGTFESVPAQVTCKGDQITFGREGSFIDSLLKPACPTELPGGASTDDRWVEVRLVTFSWARSDRKMKKDFTAWLKANRPKDRKDFQSSGAADSRRTSEREKLKYLGALRLLDHFHKDWNRASEYTESRLVDKHGNPKGLFGEQSDWNRAKLKYKGSMEEFLALG